MPEALHDVSGHPLATGDVSRLLLKYAIPSTISMLVAALYNIVDQVFIGHGVGILGNAATNVAFPLVTLANAVSLLFAIGGASNFNLELGRGHGKRSARIAANAMTCAAIFGALITAVTLLFLQPIMKAFGATGEVMPYAMTYTGITVLAVPFLTMSLVASHLIRADGSPRYSMFCSLSGALLNIVLDPVFIFKLDMGIAGAAWATVISMFVGWCFAAFYFTRFRSVRLEKKYFIPDLGQIKRIAILGAGAGFNQIAMMCVQITMNNVMNRYGAFSVYGANVPLAASGIITKVNMIFMAVVIGIAQGGQPIIGFNYGAGNYAKVRRTFKFTLSSATFVSVMVFALFQIFPREIINLFGETNEQYYSFVERYFRIFLFMTFINGIQPVTANFFSSIGKATRGLFISLTRQILFLLPLVLLFAKKWGIDGVMYAGPAADSAAALLAAFFIVREIGEIKSLEGGLS